MQYESLKIGNPRDDELTSILDVDKVGHRRRILVSVAGRDGVAGRLGKVKQPAAKGNSSSDGKVRVPTLVIK